LMLIFGSPTCAPCRGLIPDLNAFARDRAHELRVLFLSRSDDESARRFADEVHIEVPVVAHVDEELPNRYEARVTPFGFLVGEDGIIRAKGLTNNREHLELLLRNAATAQ
jgi:methylamine dehydrogenase accessory protein MauD